MNKYLKLKDIPVSAIYGATGTNKNTIALDNTILNVKEESEHNITIRCAKVSNEEILNKYLEDVEKE